jgi:hypothetical protein
MFKYLVVIADNKTQSIRLSDLCIESCTGTYDIYNIVNIYVCVVHFLVWIINSARCTVHTSKYKYGYCFSPYNSKPNFNAKGEISSSR